MKKYLFFIVVALSSFFVHAEGINLACLPERSICINCPDYQTLFPIEEFSAVTGSLDIEADKSEILSNQTYHLSGEVIVKSDEFVLSADDVVVNSVNETTKAVGNGKFQDNAFLISGDTLSTLKDSDENLIATITNANYQDYLSGQGGANGLAETIEKRKTSIFLSDATYSLCPINKNDWLIDAETIELNLEKNRGVANSAKVIFYGVPIIYLPKYSWVLQGRGSGFLTPDYDNYKESARPGENPKLIERSFRLRVPYYFNIAPDRDLVAALTYMSSRGFIYEGTYRQLLAPRLAEDKQDSIWKTQAIYLAEDKRQKLKRWLLDSTIYLDLSEKMHLTSRYYRVSDKKYFEEILRTNTNVKRLMSSLSLNYKDTLQQVEASVLSEHEQVVNIGNPEYTRVLEGLLSKNFQFGKNKVHKYTETKNELSLNEDEQALFILENIMPTITNLKVDLSSTKFNHSDPLKESGLRTYGNLRLSKQLPLPKYPKITPYTTISITKYSLNKAGQDITRSVGGAGVGIDFTINSKGSIFGPQINHKFAPIITYNYRAKKLQGNIPIFDSKDKHDDIITFSDLTSGERYTGLDRVTNANDIILSLESSFRKNDSLLKDNDLLNMKIAQSFYTDNEVVSDTLDTNFETRKSYSDIAASVATSINNFTLSSAIQFDPDKSLVVRKENRLSYIPDSRKFVTLSYGDDGTKRTGKIYGAYPLSSSIHIFAGLNREITKQTIKGVTKSYTTGVAYESCCWALRLAHFQEDKDQGNNSNNYSTGIELILKDLGSTSTPMKGRIETNIPGYSSKFW